MSQNQENGGQASWGARALRIIGYIWVYVMAAGFILDNIVILFTEGISVLLNRLSPFNIVYYIVVTIFLAPGLGAIALADKIEGKQREPL